MNATMQGAAGQLARMRIERDSGSGWRGIRSKGWAIGSGWCAEDPITAGFVRPLLRLDDPDDDGEELDEGEAAALRAGMVRLQLAQSLFGLGLPGIAAALRGDAPDASFTGAASAPAIPGRWRASIADEKEVEVVGSVVLRPREDREAAGFLVGYEPAFVEAVRAGEERLLSSELGVAFLPLLIERERATRLVDPNSTSGNTVPRFALDRMGIRPQEFFSNVVYAGSHENAIIALGQGVVDVAVTWWNSETDSNVARMSARGMIRAEDVRLIFRSDLIANGPYTVLSSLPQELRDRIRTTWLAAPASAPAAVRHRFDDKPGSFTTVAHETYLPIIGLNQFVDRLRRQGG
jgi:hypothetical protein